MKKWSFIQKYGAPVLVTKPSMRVIDHLYCKRVRFLRLWLTFEDPHRYAERWETWRTSSKYHISTSTRMLSTLLSMTYYRDVFVIDNIVGLEIHLDDKFVDSIVINCAYVIDQKFQSHYFFQCHYSIKKLLSDQPWAITYDLLKKT